MIRKTSNARPLTGSVVNGKNNSTSNAYSCDYVNNIEDSLTPVDSGWQNCTKSVSSLGVNYFTARKINNQVFVDAQLTNNSGTTISKGTRLGVLPTGFEPAHEVWVTCRPIGGEGNVGFVYFSTNGNITYYGNSSTTLGLNFNGVFISDN